MRITQDQANVLLGVDMKKAGDAVLRLTGGKVTQNQLDALASFVFNLGAGRLQSSTLLRLHKAGKYTEASNEFAKWVHAGGKVLKGLVTRRAAEAALYRS